MAKALYQPGQAEAKLDELYAAREHAMAAWDATAYNRIDSEIGSVLAAMRAEVRLGLRDDPIYTVSLAAA
jgi:hypothetical protein